MEARLRLPSGGSGVAAGDRQHHQALWRGDDTCTGCATWTTRPRFR